MSDAPLLLPGEPSPVEVCREDGRSSFVIVCDHAGNEVPRALDTLGLSPDDLQAHIAWDIGAAGVAKRLSLELDAPLFLQRYSRLVIDCNRPLAAPDSIAAESGGICVPGNRSVSSAQAEQRARAVFTPYHARIRSALAQRGRPFLLIAIHSFTPELLGVVRPFHAGVLYHRDARLAKPLLSFLRREAGLLVGDNEPYAASAATDHTIIEHAERRGAPYVELEVRQDLVADDAGQALWAEHFARAIRAASATFRF